jgi:competence protein ComGC
MDSNDKAVMVVMCCIIALIAIVLLLMMRSTTHQNDQCMQACGQRGVAHVDTQSCVCGPETKP